MRGPALPGVLLLGLGLAACGGGEDNPIDGGGGDDGGGDPDGNDLIDAVTATCTPRSGTTVVATPVTSVTEDAALLVTAPPGDRRLFVAQRDGTIRIVLDGAVLDPPFLDITGPVDAGGEMGLLGLAFHPQYAVNRKFYVFYTTDDANVVDEFLASATDPNVAEPTRSRPILSIPDFAGNHNGGMIEFGSDGFLYIGTGDGGGGGDPEETGQNLNRLLGKMLRIDVDNPGGGNEYGIPPGNPYAAGGGAPEVFMYGLRNPWRWSFDRGTGNIYIGDVGQGAVEEISVAEAASAPGKDFGWDDCEGTLDFEGGSCDAPGQANRLRPVFEEIRPGGGGTSNWASVIGGQVYRGTCFPDLTGRYFYTDHYAGGLYSFVYSGGQATDVIDHPGSFPNGITSIHADALGELYLTTVSGGIFRLEVE